MKVYSFGVFEFQVQLEGLMMQECNLEDVHLRMLGKNLFGIKKVQITGNYFTLKGIGDMTRHLKGSESLRIRSLDMSDSNLDDEGLGKLSPILPFLEELCLSDNFFTWYGIRKMTQPHKKTKRLKRLEMARCHLNEHAFYELIPLITRTEFVSLEGNSFSPLELKIFARQLRESQNSKLETLMLNNCQMDNDCLAEIAKFLFHVPNLHLQNNSFNIQGIKVIGKYYKKLENVGKLKVLNLRACKLDSECLTELAELIAELQSATLSNNNFSSADGVKVLVSALDSEKRNLKFLDLRHCRLVDGSKKALADSARKFKIEIKTW